MIKVLEYIPGFTFGGIESFVLNMNEIAKEQCEFTYLVEKDISNYMENQIKSYGANIVRIPNLTKESFWNNIKSTAKIIRNGNFDVVHVHGCDIRFFTLLFAKIYGVKKRIYHVHTIKYGRKNTLKSFFTWINIKMANVLMACSEQAAEGMYKKKAKKAIIINNGISIDKFRFRPENRIRIRKELLIDDETLVLGHIGRLTRVKNHTFLIEIIHELVRTGRKIKLLIVGEGEERKNLEDKIRSLNLEKNIILVGEKNNANEYYSAMDIFVFPSIYEGLGMALIEAQANGLKCIASATVPKQANITGEVEFLGIEDKDVSKWIDEIENAKIERYEKIDKIKEAGYDLQSSAGKLIKNFKE